MRQTYEYKQISKVKCPKCGRIVKSTLTFESGGDALLGYTGICKCGWEPAYG